MKMGLKVETVLYLPCMWLMLTNGCAGKSDLCLKVTALHLQELVTQFRFIDRMPIEAILVIVPNT